MPHRARPAILLGVLSVVPFLWGAASELSRRVATFGLGLVGPRFMGPYIGLEYGLVLLAVLSGAMFGFALRSGRGDRLAPLALVPALWGFLFVNGGPTGAAILLAAGYLGALAIDWLFWRQGLSPVWWWPIRVAQTAVAVICLGITAFV